MSFLRRLKHHEWREELLVAREPFDVESFVVEGDPLSGRVCLRSYPMTTRLLASSYGQVVGRFVKPSKSCSNCAVIVPLLVVSRTTYRLSKSSDGHGGTAAPPP